MLTRYAVVAPATAGNLALARVVSRHKLLHKALEAGQRQPGTQVRELVGRFDVGDVVRYADFHRWD